MKNVNRNVPESKFNYSNGCSTVQNLKNFPFTVKYNRTKIFSFVMNLSFEMTIFLHRGTAAIGPLIAALKDGKSVTYEGKEVTYDD